MNSFEKLVERGYAEGRVRVRYAETDQMGVVYHANYFVWFEVGRVEFMRQLGTTYKQMEAEDVMIAVVEATARYKSPAKYDDELIVKTRLATVRRSIVRFHYEVVRAADEAVLCEGETVHLCIGRDMKKKSLPAHFLEMFERSGHRMKEHAVEHGKA